MRRILAGLVAATCLACNSTHDATPAGDASTEGATATYGASACGQCVASSCAAAVTACNGAPDCASWLGCVDACPVGADGNVDSSCASACTAPASSAGQAAQAKLTACTAGSSCPACGGSSDAGAEGGILHESCAPDMDAANACSKCIHEECCDTRLACLNDPSCLGFLNCILDCEDHEADDAAPSGSPPDGGPYACDLWCGAASNPSLDKYAALQTCSQILCTTASTCGGADACLTCQYQYCASEVVAVSASADGYLFDDCIAQCPSTDTTCLAQCQTDYPSVQSASQSWIACLQQHCPTCNNGG